MSRLLHLLILAYLPLAARHLFVEEGPGVSMRVIAKEAGVGVATATRHFPGAFSCVRRYLNRR